MISSDWRGLIFEEKQKQKNKKNGELNLNQAQNEVFSAFS